MQANIQSVVKADVDVDDEADACAGVNADDADMALNEKKYPKLDDKNKDKS